MVATYHSGAVSVAGGVSVGRTVARHRMGTNIKTGIGDKVLKILIALIVVILIGGAVFLATWDIPAPNQQVEKVIPDDRFPR
jgi:hypothetical protein